MLYMLDSNIIPYHVRGNYAALFANLDAHAPDDLCVSVITLSELKYGVLNSSNPERNAVALAIALSGVEVLPFTSDAAQKYAEVRFDLSRRGCLIGPNDLLIAAHALAEDATLVTHNVGEFERVDGLRVEDWTYSKT